MAHHFIDAGTHTLGIPLIAKTGRRGTMLHTIVIAYLVDFKSIHARMDMLGHLVQHTGVHHAAPAYALNLFRGLDQFACGHQFALVLPIHHLFVKLGNGLTRQAMPSSFLFENHLIIAKNIF